MVSSQNNIDEIEFLLPYIKGQNNLRILDIGCGDGSLLSNIYNFMPTKISRLVGIENYSGDFTDENDCDFVTYHNGCIGNKPMSPELTAIINQDGFDYLKNLLTPHDLIIFSNVLHFSPWDKQKEVLKLALTKLTFSGIIYLKNANEFHKSEKIKYPITLDNIEDLKSICKVLPYTKTDIHYNLILKP